MQLPTELQCRVIEFVPARIIGIMRHFRALRSFFDEHLEVIINRVSDVHLARIAQERQRYDYNGYPFVWALKHWYEKRGVIMDGTGMDMRASCGEFVDWYAECCGYDAADARDTDLEDYALHLTRLHLSQHLPGGRLFIEESIGAVTPEQEISHLRSYKTFPGWAMVRNDAVISCDPQEHDWRMVESKRTILGIGLLYGVNETINQRTDGTTSVFPPPAMHDRFAHLTSLVQRVGDTAWNGAVEDDNALNVLFDLAPMPQSRRICYCLSDHRLFALASSAVRRGRLSDPLDKVKVLESVFLK